MQIVDSCDSCPLNQVNIAYPAFITNLTNNLVNTGSVPVQFRQVGCSMIQLHVPCGASYCVAAPMRGRTVQ